MPVVPTRDQDFIDFCEQHVSTWNANRTTLNLTTAQITAFQTLVTKSRTVFNAALAARQASKDATLNQNTVLAATRKNCADLIKQIRVTADMSADPDTIYLAASLPPPAAPQYNIPPNAPTNVKATLQTNTGALKITWKATQPEGGTAYIVKRRTGASGAFEFVGIATGKKSFVDGSFPSGASHIEYVVQGQRGPITGPESAVLAVNFGTGAQGQTFILSETFGGKKIAA